MPKRQSSNWNGTNNNELRKAVNNFNSKIRRLEKKGLTYLPEKIKFSEISQEINTKGDYNAVLNSIKKFSKRGSENLKQSKLGVEVTEWEYNELKKRINKINRKRKKKLEELKEIQNETGLEQLDTESKNALKPKKFRFNKIKKSDFEKFKESVYKQSSNNYEQQLNQIFKDNYIKALYSVFGFQADDIVNLVAPIEPNLFYQYCKENPILLSIKFIYDPLESQLLHDLILEEWEGVLNVT